MKKIVCFLVLSVLAISGFVLPTLFSMKESANAYDSFIGRNYNLTPLSLSPDNLTPLVVPTSQTPGDRIETDIYSGCGERVFFAEGLGLLTTADGRVLYDGGNSSVVAYHEENKEFLNGANQTLQAVINSTQTRHIIQRGAMNVRPVGITLNDELFLITIRHSSLNHMTDGRGEMAIYATRQFLPIDWYRNLNPFRWFNKDRRVVEVFFNMFNDPIPSDWIVRESGSFTVWDGIFTLGFGLIARNNGGWFPVAEVLDRTTLRALRTDLRASTWHPWDRLMEGTGGMRRAVKSVDDDYIFINPRTQQLSDFMSYPLFNSVSGRPIILRDGDVVTVDRDSSNGHAVLAQQKIENGVLLEAVTVEDILNTNRPFHVGIIDVAFGGGAYGSYDAIVFHDGYDSDGNPKWRFPNGESADGIIRDMRFTNTFGWDDLPGLFGNFLADNMDWLRWILLGIGIFILLLVLGFVAFVFKTLKGLFAPLEAVGTSAKTMTNDFNNTAQSRQQERERQRQLKEMEAELEHKHRQKELNKKLKELDFDDE
jgi:Sec-independent protein translocase protein TatA